MRAVVFTTIAALACLSLAPPAAGQATDEQRQCINETDEYSPEQQLEACTAVIQAGPADHLPLAYYNRGLAHLRRDDLRQAIADWSETIRLDPKDADALVNRGTTYHREGKFALAIADYDRAIALDPKPQADVYANRGNSHRRAGNRDRALADLSRAIEIDPKYADAYYYRGNVHSDAKQYQRAIADYDAAIRLNPKYAVAYKARGKALVALGRTTDGQADIAKAASLTSNNRE